MKPFALALAVVVTAVSAAVDVPEAYQVIARRNLFSPSRTAAPPVNAMAAVEAPPPAETVTLTGVAVLEGQATALFAGSAPALSGARHQGESLGSLRLGTVCTAGVSLEPEGEGTPLRLGVGQSLRRIQGQPWQRSTEPVVVPPAAAAATPAAASPSAPQAAESSGDAGDVLKRLLERRRKEMTP